MNAISSMGMFWIAGVTLVGIALAFVLPPLLRRREREGGVSSAGANVAINRAQIEELGADIKSGTLDPDQYGEALRDIEARVGQEGQAADTADTSLRGRGAGVALGAIIPMASIITYLLFGSPGHLESTPVAAAAAAGQNDPAAMIAALQTKLEATPDDGAGWATLGRFFVATGRNQEGAQALQRAVQLVPGDAQLLADYAEALAITQNRIMAGMPAQLVARALALDGKNEKALLLGGVAASQQHDFANALVYWRRLLEMTPKDSDLARQLAGAIEQVEQQVAAIGLVTTSSSTGSAPLPQSLSGTVTVSRQLAARVAPGDTVFIVAQIPGGPPRPLAVQRITAGQLPYRFTLDDSMSMSGDDRLSNHAEVLLTARVSKSGQAMPRSGDLQGRIGSVKLGQQDISLSIDAEVP